MLYPYLMNEYLLFLQIFAKIPILRFIFLTEFETHFAKKYAPRLRQVLFVLILIFFSLIFIGIGMQSFIVYRFAVLGGIASIGGLLLMPQSYYSLKISEKDVGLDVRKSLVNSLMFYLPLQIWHWASFFGIVFSGYIIFPFIRLEYQTMLLGSILGICFYMVFIDIPFWKGQKVSIKSRLEEKTKKKETILADLRTVSDTSDKKKLLNKISYQLELLILENEIKKIESEPLHPHKGVLSPLSVLIGALLSPMVEWVLRIIAM